jgi:hypothetical protein
VPDDTTPDTLDAAWARLEAAAADVQRLLDADGATVHDYEWAEAVDYEWGGDPDPLPARHVIAHRLIRTTTEGE